MFCSKCGNEMDGAAKFCQQCGMPPVDQSPIKIDVTDVTDRRTAEFTLGIIAGIFGIIAVVVAVLAGGLVSAIASASGEQSAAQGIGSMSGWTGLFALLFTLWGIIGAAITKQNGKLGGMFMVAAALGTIIYIIPGILFAIAGIISLVKRNQTAARMNYAIWIPVTCGIALILGIGMMSLTSASIMKAEKANAASPTSTHQKTTQATPEEQYLKNVIIANLTTGYEDDLLDGRVAVIRGKVKNTGDKILSEVEVTVYFKDSTGTRIHEGKFYPVLDSPISMDDEQVTPLKPGYIRNFGFKEAACPKEWKTGSVDYEITDVQFENQ